MGLKLDEVSSEEVADVEAFFTQSSIREFREIFPVEMADFAAEHFDKREFFYAARNNGELVGAMHFSIQGGVGHLAAIQVKKDLPLNLRERIRHKLFQKFIKTCNEKECHLALVWIPYQYRDAIAYYIKQGFKKEFTARNFWYKNDFILLTKEL
ncbi:MAG: GNAT family N-acetyltransferase [Candidatus Bathyarchaeota archaeon]|nr:GNAT family N-acetyltransferase [Candidatus Bathyarchaeota archaeon]